MAQNPEATVVFGVLNETSETESRVALTPDIVTRLKRSGVSSLIEACQRAFIAMICAVLTTILEIRSVWKNEWL